MILRQLRATSAELDALKHGGERIVILNRDRIELVIVTARAADGHAEHRSTHRLHDFIQTIRPCLTNSGRLAAHRRSRHMWTRNEEASGLAIARLITSKLVAHELVIRTVFIEGADDVVAINPGVFAVEICLRSIRFRPANDIEPMLRPTLAKVR